VGGKWWCIHDYEIIHEETTEAVVDRFGEQGTRLKYISPWLFTRTKVVFLKCKKCGRIVKDVTVLRPE